MIIVKLIGGLGNQLFQYAFGRAQAERLGCELKLDASAFERGYDLRRYSLEPFQIKASLATRDDLARVQFPSGWLMRGIRRAFSRPLQGVEYFAEANLAFDPSMQDLTGERYFEGYWQTEKYFSPLREKLLRELTLRQELSGRDRERKQQVTAAEDSIALHVRRSDFVSNPKTRALHDVCTLAYYERGLEYIGHRLERPVVFVFSDDMDWVRHSIPISFPTVYVDPPGDGKDYVDLHLMSCCRHQVISNSSFSWWSAWLNSFSDKIVVAPDRWYRPGTKEAPDIWPNSWTRVRVDPSIRAA